MKEGKLFLSTYEQRTPDGTKNDAANITNALRHGRDKGADIAVIYMKHGKHSRNTVEQGIKDSKPSTIKSKKSPHFWLRGDQKFCIIMKRAYRLGFLPSEEKTIETS